MKTSSGIKSAIVDLTNAMKADYGVQFKKLFSSDEELNQYKNRLLTELKGRVSAADLVNGYEVCISVKENQRYVPTVPMLVGYALDALSERLKREKEQARNAEMAGIELLPVTCDPLKMLADAKAVAGDVVSIAERAARHDELLKGYYAGGAIKRISPFDKDRCAVSGCNSIGVRASGNKGGGSWYCTAHANMYV